MNARGLIRRAMLIIGASSAGNPLTDDEATDGLVTLNAMVDTWRTQSLFLFADTRTTFSFIANDAVYTIGTGGDVNVIRPINLTRASILLNPGDDDEHEIPIDVLTTQRWQSLPNKQITSTWPQVVYYDRSWSAGLGQLHYWPVPTDATVDGVLYLPTTIESFATLDTNYTFPPGYEEALTYNLALRLSPEYNRPVQDAVLAFARESIGNVKRMNLRPEELSLDPGYLAMGHRHGRHVDILEG